MESIQELIRPELLILIPVLYFIGMAAKNSQKIEDKIIPVILGLCGVFLATLYVFATSPLYNVSDALQMVFAGITQGVLCAGCSVYVNQIVKQNGKDE